MEVLQNMSMARRKRTPDMHYYLPVFAAALALLAVTSLARADELGSAAGQIEVDGKTIDLKHAYAMVVGDPQDDRGIELLLTSHPIAEDAMAKLFDLGAVRQDGGIFIMMDAQGKNSLIRISHPALGDRYLQWSGGIAVNITAFDAKKKKHLAGSLKTADERLGTTYSIEATFDAQVLEPAKE